MLLLIRHALAGDRHAWEGDDRVRPVDDRGRLQSDALVDTLAEFQIDRIVSSPYLRCVQTVEPLAEALGLEIELDEQLGRRGSTKWGRCSSGCAVSTWPSARTATCRGSASGSSRRARRGSSTAELVPDRYIRPPA
jgi:broad specificity phosphatase PhoE